MHCVFLTTHLFFEKWNKLKIVLLLSFLNLLLSCTLETQHSTAPLGKEKGIVHVGLTEI